jgi:hypothetical protein
VLGRVEELKPNRRQREGRVPRDFRQARNQGLFREVNERIADLSAGMAAEGHSQQFICECGQLGCMQQIELPLSVYARLRELPHAFVVLVGHEDLEQEKVLERGEGFLIVRIASPAPRERSAGEAPRERSAGEAQRP